MNITPEQFTRVNNDVNGNPRYTIHFLDLLTESEQYNETTNKLGLDRVNYLYSLALAKAKSIGGKKYHTKTYGGGIVFQTYNLNDLCNKLNSL